MSEDFWEQLEHLSIEEVDKEFEKTLTKLSLLSQIKANLIFHDSKRIEQLIREYKREREKHGA